MKTGVALTIGTFDGLHRGHRAIFRTLMSAARRWRIPPVVVTFPFPPRCFFHKNQPVELLTSLDEKKGLFKRFGVKRVKVLRFDRNFARQTPEDFFRRVLLRRFRAKFIAVGEGFAFGKDRRGNVRTLKRLGEEAGVRVTIVPRVSAGKKPVSSSRIRKLLKAGDIARANALLGSRYFVEGRVVQGRHRGKSLGFPTANINVSPEKLLPRGVFAVRAHWGKKSANALCNIGLRPTFESAQTPVVEAHLLAHPGSLYGKTMRLEFLDFLRPEKKFSSPQALARQIAKDMRYFK